MYLFWSGAPVLHTVVTCMTVHAQLCPRACASALPAVRQEKQKKTRISSSSLRPAVSLLKCCQCHLVTAALQPLNWFRKSILVILRSVNSAQENEVQATATSSTPTQPVYTGKKNNDYVPCIFVYSLSVFTLCF